MYKESHIGTYGKYTFMQSIIHMTFACRNAINNTFFFFSFFYLFQKKRRRKLQKIFVWRLRFFWHCCWMFGSCACHGWCNFVLYKTLLLFILLLKRCLWDLTIEMGSNIVQDFVLSHIISKLFFWILIQSCQKLYFFHVSLISFDHLM